MKGKRLDPLKTDEIKISLRSFKRGTIEIKPRIVCLDWVGRHVTFDPDPVVFNVLSAVLPGRVSTGYSDLDNLLFGGIPENYAVVLESPSSDERELLVKRFLEAGVKNGQTTYYISSEVGDIMDITEGFQSVFSLFLCNPRADAMVKSFPNLFKLKGVESLIDIDIALIKSFRTLGPAQSGPRRACITIVSDVLLQHHPVNTRRWLNSLIPQLKSKGFTVLAVIDPGMHSSTDLHAILDILDGEIDLYEKNTSRGPRRFLRILRMQDQKYSKNEQLIGKP